MTRRLYRPTDEQRGFVMQLAAFRMPLEQIASLIINPDSNRSLHVRTLQRAFRKELAEGAAKVKATVINKWHAAVEAGEKWAIEAGLRMYGYADDGRLNININANESGGQAQGLEVKFVESSHKYEDLPVGGIISPPDRQPFPHPRDYEEAQVVTDKVVESKPDGLPDGLPFEGRPGRNNPLPVETPPQAPQPRTELDHYERSNWNGGSVPFQYPSGRYSWLK